jgi:hypothetical protein
MSFKYQNKLKISLFFTVLISNVLIDTNKNKLNVKITGVKNI